MSESASELRDFVVRACGVLALDTTRCADGDYELATNAELRSLLRAGPKLRLTFDKDRFQSAPAGELELVSEGGVLLQWLIEAIRRRGTVGVARVPGDAAALPTGAALVTALDCRGGSVELVESTTAEDTAAVCLVRLRARAVETFEELVRVAVSLDGAQLDASLADFLVARRAEIDPGATMPALDLDAIERAATAHADSELRRVVTTLEAKLHPRRAKEEAQIEAYFGAMRAGLEQEMASSPNPDERRARGESLEAVERQRAQRLGELRLRFEVHGECMVRAVQLVRYAERRAVVAVRCGDARTTTTVRWPAGAPEPLGIVCGRTGRSCRRFALTAAGELVDAELVATCARTGRVLLRDETGVCAVSKETLGKDLLSTCPVSGATVATDRLVECSSCRQRVSPAEADGGVCRACRNPQELGGRDEIVRLVTTRYPALTAWGSWRGRQTRTVWLLFPSSLWRLGRIVALADGRVLSYETKPRLVGRWHREELDEP